MRLTMRNPWIYTLFLIPTFVLLAVFFLIPLTQSFRYGLTQWDGIQKPLFVGFDNFTQAFRDKDFWKSFINNLYFIAFTCLIQLPIYITIAILLSRVKKFASFYKIAIFTPVILSTAVIGILWGVVYEPEIGLLNQFLRMIGLDSLALFWLSDERTAMYSILITNAWQWTGFNVILILTGILGIPKEINEAAEIDGAGAFRRVRSITLPLIRPVLVVLLLLTVIGSMKTLDLVMVMTNGGPYGQTEVMGTYMIKQAYQLGNYGYANAIAILIFLFTLFFASIMQFLSKKWGREAS